MDKSTNNLRSSHHRSAVAAASVVLLVGAVLGAVALTRSTDAVRTSVAADTVPGATVPTKVTDPPRPPTLSADAKQQLTTSRGAASTSPSTTTPVTPGLTTGLIAKEDVDAELAKFLTVSNGYGGTAAGTYYYVIAGANLDDASSGEVFMDSGAPSGSDGPHLQTFPLPGHGALTITSAQLPTVDLSAADGTTYRLDVTTGTFTPAG